MLVRGVAVRNDPYTDSLAGGQAWATTNLSFSFPSASQFSGYTKGSEPSVGFASLNVGQRDVVRSVLGLISTVVDLTFAELTGPDAGSAVLRFGLTSDTDGAHAYLPSAAEVGGDSWFLNDSSLSSPVKANFAFHTFLHEIGHALGLEHPFEDNGKGRMPSDREWMAYTVMSYRSTKDSSAEGYTNGAWDFAQSFMMEDIAALQHMYGANYSSNSGDTTYTWDPSTGQMFLNGIGQGAPGAPRIFSTIWDGGGIDTYDFSNQQEGWHTVTIDLRPGEWSTFAPFTQLADLGSFRNPPGHIANAQLFGGNWQSLVENAIGSPANDVIHGNAVANSIGGGVGQDIIRGYEGDDRLAGGAGYDQLFGGSGDDTLEGGGDSGNLFGEDGNDLLQGGEDEDFLDGGSGDDALVGGAGRDKLFGSQGADILHGGDDDDQLDGGEGDDELIGASGDDRFVSSLGADRMTGGLGDDYYYIDNPWDQVIEFMDEGFDTVQTPFDFTAFAEVEQITLLGSATVNATGNASVNTLWGNQSANILNGLGGADKMYGGPGDDTYYVDDPGDTIRDYENGGIDTVYSSVTYVLPPPSRSTQDPYAGASLSPDIFKLLPQPIENLILTGVADLSATGNETANRVQGNPGNNVLGGLAGDDALLGHDGDDQLAGGAGIDTMTGGAGHDVFRGTISELSGDVITDLEARDRIHITDAPGNWSINRSGAALLLDVGGSISLPGAEDLTMRVRISAAGGMDLIMVSNASSSFNAEGGDFNGDGKDDVLWRHSSGTVTDWLATNTGGFAHNDANIFAYAPAEWQIAGTGDFNGDGKHDILWRHNSGTVTNWLGSNTGGFAYNDANIFTYAPTEWQIAGTGDFNGDGNDDILWRHTSGTVTDWLGTNAGGFTDNRVNIFSHATIEWQIAGTADFNGDGNGDILWRHSSGTITNWLGTDTGGFAYNDANIFAYTPTEWQIAGTGDFDGDGNGDILWRHTSGTVTDWLGTDSGGFIYNDTYIFKYAPTEWQIAGTGDFNGDGNDDLLWRHNSGTVTDWLGTDAGGFTDNRANAFVDAPLGWIIQPDLIGALPWDL
jgi:serralysin